MGFKLGIGLFTGQIPPGMDRSFHEEYRATIELVKLVEEVGLDGAWVSEHHFAEDGYLPSLLPMMAAFAAVTNNIDLGTGVVLAPFHDPIRLAEDFAVVDQISGGRTICGLGIGWRDEEFREFGIDTKTRVRRLSEMVDVLRLAWNEERFDYRGKHYSYSGVAVTPKPARVPPIFVGGSSTTPSGAPDASATATFPRVFRTNVPVPLLRSQLGNAPPRDVKGRR